MNGIYRFVSGKEMFQDVYNKETASSLLYKYILPSFKKQMKLSKELFKVCRGKIGKSVRYLTDKYESKTYIPEWKLYVPQIYIVFN